MLSHLVIVAGLLGSHVVMGISYERCDFAKLLVQHFDRSVVNSFACIGNEGGKLDTGTVTETSGETYYGIFQIAGKYCADGGMCRVPCDKLRDDDLHDDIECVKTIYGSKYEGRFNAFGSWDPTCRDKDLRDYTRGCNISTGKT